MGVEHAELEGPRRRVREDVRDSFAVVVFSAAASSALAVAVLLFARIAG